jgi:Na+-driven multidrug efflux pump
MKTPSYIIIAAGVINLILDPVFIFGLGPIPALGMQGAALATLLGRVVTFVVALRIMHNKYDMFTFEKITLKQLLSSWKEILQIGLPTVAGNVIVPIGFGVIIDFTAHYGSAAVAALGAASRVEAIMMTVFMATAAVLSPFIGQNWGARKFDRIDRALKIVFAFCLVWGAAMIGFFELFKEPISHFVKSDPAVVKVMVLYLGIAPFAMAFRGVLMISGSALTVLKKPYEAMGLTIAYMFIFFVPLAYYGSKYFGLSGIFWSLVVGAVITSIIAYFLLYSRYNKIKARDILRIDSDDDNDLEVAMAE